LTIFISEQVQLTIVAVLAWFDYVSTIPAHASVFSTFQTGAGRIELQGAIRRGYI